jgi:hypothetical protein
VSPSDAESCNADIYRIAINVATQVSKTYLAQSVHSPMITYA